MSRPIVSSPANAGALFSVLAALIVLFCPRPGAAQWQVQMGYSYAEGPAPHGGALHVQRRVLGSSDVGLHLRVEGRYQRGRGDRDLAGAFAEALDQTYRADVAPVVETRVGRLLLRVGLALGMAEQSRKWLECPVDVSCLRMPITRQRRSAFAGGLAELAAGLRGPVYLFLAYRRDWIFSSEDDPLGIQSPASSFQAGLGISL